MIGIYPLIAQRRSLRSIDTEKSIPEDQLFRLLEAARWAPSTGNAQPWRFVVAREKLTLERMRKTLKPGNQSWAGAAPLLLVICANPSADTIADDKPYYLFDCGLAAENLILQGISEGLVMHPMLGWDEAAVKTELSIPDDNRVVVIIAVGHPGKFEDLPIDLQKRETAPRVRKSLDEMVHYERWKA